MSQDLGCNDDRFNEMLSRVIPLNENYDNINFEEQLGNPSTQYTLFDVRKLDELFFELPLNHLEYLQGQATVPPPSFADSTQRQIQQLQYQESLNYSTKIPDPLTNPPYYPVTSEWDEQNYQNYHKDNHSRTPDLSSLPIRLGEPLPNIGDQGLPLQYQQQEQQQKALSVKGKTQKSATQTKTRAPRKKVIKKNPSSNDQQSLSKSANGLGNNKQNCGNDWDGTIHDKIKSLTPKALPLPKEFYPELLLNTQYWTKLYDVNWEGMFVRYTPCLWSFMTQPDFHNNVYVWKSDETSEYPLATLRVTSENISLVDSTRRFEKVLKTYSDRAQLPKECSLELEGDHYKIMGEGIQFCAVWPSGKVDQLYLKMKEPGDSRSLITRMFSLLYWPEGISVSDLNMEISSRVPTILWHDPSSGERICMLHNSNASGNDTVPFNWITTNFLAMTNNLEDRFCDLKEFINLQPKPNSKARSQQVNEIADNYFTRILPYPTGPAILFKCKGPPNMFEFSSESFLPFSITEYFDFQRYMEDSFADSSVRALLDYMRHQYKSSHSLSNSPKPEEIAGFARYLFELASCWVRDSSDKYKDFRDRLVRCGEQSPFVKGRYASYGPYHSSDPCAAVRSVISGAIAHLCKDFMFFPVFWEESASIDSFILLNSPELFGLGGKLGSSRARCGVTPKMLPKVHPVVSPNCEAQDVNSSIKTDELTDKMDLENDQTSNAEKLEHIREPEYITPTTPPTNGEKQFVPTLDENISITAEDIATSCSQPTEGKDFPHTSQYGSCQSPHPPSIQDSVKVLDREVPRQVDDKKPVSRYERHIKLMCAEIRKRESSQTDSSFWAKTNRNSLLKVYYCMTVTRPNVGITTLCNSEKVVHSFIVSHLRDSLEPGMKTKNNLDITPHRSNITKKRGGRT